MIFFGHYAFFLQMLHAENAYALFTPSVNTIRQQKHPHRNFPKPHEQVAISQIRRRRVPTLLESSNNKEESTTTSTSSSNEDTNSVPNLSDLEYANESAAAPTTIASDSPPKVKIKSTKWQADNFERDYQLLQIALAKDKSLSNLQQLQRKYILEHGFRRRPLLKDLLKCAFNIGAWTVLLISCNRAGGGLSALKDSKPLWRKACILLSESILSMVALHYWVIVMVCPLILLKWLNSEETNKRIDIQYRPPKRGLLQKLIGTFGPSALVLDSYFEDPREESNLPSFFYSLDDSYKSKRRDTKNFVLCLLENWSSAVIASLVWRVVSVLAAGIKYQYVTILFGRGPGIAQRAQFLLSRLITRLGAAAALYQYPQLLFELHRKDQPRPLCRATSIMQPAVQTLFRWLPLGISADLALLAFSIKEHINLSSLMPGFACSIIAPLCHVATFAKLIRISRSNDLPISLATEFPEVECIASEELDGTVDNKHQVKWRYQILWRTPQRISQTLRVWATYLVTNHKPFLSEMEGYKSMIPNDGFSTEGIQFSKRDQDQDDEDELLAHKDEIIESLSLIFRDREAAITNATNVRYMKHQESYDSKELDDVLGVAIQQTFGLGISYDFEHFDAPDENEVSIHQLRARMAKSAIREKKKLDSTLSDELALLHRLKDNVSTGNNDEIARREMEAVEQEIRDRHNIKVERIKSALMTTIPTNAESPEGMDKFDSPIMVAEYVNLTAPAEKERGGLKAAVLEAPDPILAIEEYTRRDFGDEAADAYRQEELAYRQKEKNMLNEIRKRHVKLEDESKSDKDDN